MAHGATHQNMNNEEKTILTHFETRVRQLILQYRKLQEEKLSLQAEIHQLADSLEQAQTKIRQLQTQYDNLKLAKMMAINNDDLTEAKKQINTLVRKIDKSIALLGI